MQLVCSIALCSFYVDFFVDESNFFGFSPVALAIAEAYRLFPNRPIGTILSIGLDPSQNEFAYRAVDLARISDESLNFVRLLPSAALLNVTAIETDIYKIALLEEQVRSYIKNDSSVRLCLDVIIKNLLKSYNRRELSDMEDRRRDFKSRRSSSELSFQNIFDKGFRFRQEIRNAVKISSVDRKQSSQAEIFQDDIYESKRNALARAICAAPVKCIGATIMITILLCVMTFFKRI